MSYPAHPIPTLDQLASGELEPTSQMFKGAVGAYRTAVWQGIAIALTFQWSKMLGFSDNAPDTFLGMALQAAAFTFFQALWSSRYIRRHRKPSVAQVQHLADLVRDDPSLAHQVARFGDQDFTFFKVQQFVLKNSAKANEARMNAAIDRLDAAVEGRGSAAR